MRTWGQCDTPNLRDLGGRLEQIKEVSEEHEPSSRTSRPRISERVDDDEIDPDVLLAAVIEAVADGLPNRDADVIPLKRDEARDPDRPQAPTTTRTS